MTLQEENEFLKQKNGVLKLELEKVNLSKDYLQFRMSIVENTVAGLNKLLSRN